MMNWLRRVFRARTERVVRINTNMAGMGRINLGRHDISHFVRGVEFSTRAGKDAELTLRIVAERYVLETDADVRAVVESIKKSAK